MKRLSAFYWFMLVGVIVLMGCSGGSGPGLQIHDSVDVDYSEAKESDNPESDYIDSNTEITGVDVKDAYQDRMLDVDHIKDAKEVTGNMVLCQCPADRPACYVSGGLYWCVKCMDDSDCKPGERCVVATNYHGHVAYGKCVKAECKTDADCSPFRCDTKTGKCVVCLKDADCGHLPMYCDEHHYCQQRTCKSSEDCPDGLICKNGYCIECETPDDCPQGQTCYHSGICGPYVCKPDERKCTGKYSYYHCVFNGSMYRVGSCQTPDDRFICKDGFCVETGPKPHECDKNYCDQRECGFDKCGNFCGACDSGEYCDDTGHCKPLPSGCAVSDKPGCNHCACEQRVCKGIPDCCTDQWGFDCVSSCDALLKENGRPGCPTCALMGVPSCDILQCGLTSCGAFCGGCGPGEFCKKGGCVKGVAPDLGNLCLSDAQCLAGYCRDVAKNGLKVCTQKCSKDLDCPGGWKCSDDGFCAPADDCLKNCRADSKCGGYPDGCGGVCEGKYSCPDGKRCSHGTCGKVSDGCEPATVGGCGNCKCETCVCNIKPECCLIRWSQECVDLCTGVCDPKGEMSKFCWGGSNLCGFLYDCGIVDLHGHKLDCGKCPDNMTCLGNKCVGCTPNCKDKECGPDGCGGDCFAHQNDSGSIPMYPTGVYCDHYKLWWVPRACFVQSSGGGPSCDPGPDGCFDKDCICNALPKCCSGTPGSWDQDCVEYAKDFCGLDCTPKRWHKKQD